MIINGFILSVISFLIASTTACQHKEVVNSVLSRTDTLTILQTVLADEELISAAVLYFPSSPLKVIQNKIVKPNYRLIFNNQLVKLLTVEEHAINIIEAYPKQLIVHFTRFEAMHRDTVLLVSIVYPGNATNIYQICRKDNISWEILSDQKGKL